MSKTPTPRFPELKGSVFIVTYGRSGSTLLQSLLQGIPGAHISGENFNTLYHMFRAAQSASRTKRIWGKKKQAADNPWYGADKIAPLRLRRKMVDLFVNEIIQPPKDVRWYGFKEIRYPSTNNDFDGMMTFIRNNFPNAVIVFNSRNGEDVAKSRWWKNTETKDVLEMVKTMDARFAKYTAEHPEQCFHARYEDIVADATCLKPLFAMMDEPFDTAHAEKVLGKKLTH